MDERERAEIEILKAQAELLKAQAALARYEAGVSECDIREEINPYDLTPAQMAAVIDKIKEFLIFEIRSGGVVKDAFEKWDREILTGANLNFQLDACFTYPQIMACIEGVREVSAEKANERKRPGR